MSERVRPAGQRIAYVRVSTAGQNLARQLQAVGECDLVFEEKQSGASARDRPQLQALIRHVRPGDHVVVASMDRLARSVIDLNGIVQQLTGDPATHTAEEPRKGASVEFLKEHLTFTPDRTDPFASFQLNMMGAFAQFERELIRQRQADGIAAAKKAGKYKGRPRTLDTPTIQQVRDAAATGEPKVHIARRFGISRATLYRYLQQSAHVDTAADT